MEVSTKRSREESEASPASGAAPHALADGLARQLEQEAQRDAYDPLNPHTQSDVAKQVK